MADLQRAARADRFRSLLLRKKVAAAQRAALAAARVAQREASARACADGALALLAEKVADGDAAGRQRAAVGVCARCFRPLGHRGMGDYGLGDRRFWRAAFYPVAPV